MLETLISFVEGLIVVLVELVFTSVESESKRGRDEEQGPE